MFPILLHIGDFTIRSYGAMAAAGFLVAYYFLNLNRRYAKLSADQVSTLLVIGIVAGIIGARIFYVVQFWDSYKDNLFRIVRIDQGGLVFYGGFLLTMLAIFVYCRKAKLDFVRVLDLFAPPLALAHACGRIGCFLNGCCYGKPTGLFWGVVYPAGSHPAEQYPGMALHPVQLYEAGAQVALFFLYFRLVRHAKRGVAMASYLTCYGILRFLNELLRGDNPKVFNLFTPAQLIGLAIIPAGIGLLIYFLRKPERNEPKDSQLQN